MPGPGAINDRLEQVVNAWQTLAPTQSFGGMTLAQFKTAIQPSLDTRASIASLENQLLAAQNARDDADKVSLDKVQLVINGVIGDPAHGPDSDLYEAMGYVRKSERQTGLTRKGNAPAATAEKA